MVENSNEQGGGTIQKSRSRNPGEFTLLTGADVKNPKKRATGKGPGARQKWSAPGQEVLCFSREKTGDSSIFPNQGKSKVHAEVSES